MTQLTSQRLTASTLFALLLLLTATLLQARRISSRRLIIHVPVKMKTHHHTHTVYRALHGGGGGGGGGGVKQTVYKLIGFSGEGGHHESHGYGHSGHGAHGAHGGHSSHSDMSHGEITYEDKHDCESGKLMPMHRDMVYNHYSRHDQDTDGLLTDYAEEQDEFIDVRDAWL